MPNIAEVIIDLPLKCKNFFHYLIPENLKQKINYGSLVVVPFGKTTQLGFVVNFPEKSEIKELKKIIEVDESFNLSEKQLFIARWITENYLCSLREAILCFVPPFSKKNIVKIFIFNENCQQDLSTLNNQQELLLNYIKKKSPTLFEIQKQFNNLKLKQINEILNFLLEKGIIKTTYKIFQLTSEKKVIYVSLNNSLLKGNLPLKNAEKINKLFEFLKENKEIEKTKIKSLFNISTSVINKLTKQNILIEEQKQQQRIPLELKQKLTTQENFLLTEHQQKALKFLKEKLNSNKFSVNLIFGVTGSGKTEIYLQIIEEVLKQNKSAIMLIPEISLTPQTSERFLNRFGNKIAVLHSKLSAGERFDQWQKIKEGKINIVVGARSAIFSPLKNLGLIIIDEEQESSYKQDSTPRYHTREVAEEICRQNNALLILGSATPSLESYNNAKTANYNLLILPERVNQQKFPEVEIVDMRKEEKENYFSQKLLDEIQNTLNKNEQVLLFLNRRGYAPFLICRDCGFIYNCPHCAVTLTYHKNPQRLLCHYCGYISNVPLNCSECKGTDLFFKTIGTQAVEEKIKKIFPAARVIRMDKDTTYSKDAYLKILNDFKNKKYNILIGTQIIAKGHDIPGISLAGIINADVALNLPDFRAAEKTFQLLIQVAGRTGRKEKQGKVIIQTYLPFHYAVKNAQEKNLQNFYEAEIYYRSKLNYPPFSYLVNIILWDNNEEIVKNKSLKLKEILNPLTEKSIDILGPVPCTLSKIQDKFRYHLILRCKDKKMLLQELAKIYQSLFAISKNLIIDINPQSML